MNDQMNQKNNAPLALKNEQNIETVIHMNSSEYWPDPTVGEGPLMITVTKSLSDFGSAYLYLYFRISNLDNLSKI